MAEPAVTTSRIIAGWPVTRVLLGIVLIAALIWTAWATRALVELQHLVARYRELRPQIVVSGIDIRHHGIEPVVPSLELDEHQHAAVVGRIALLCHHLQGQQGTDARRAHRPQKVTSFHALLRPGSLELVDRVQREMTYQVQPLRSLGRDGDQRAANSS